MRDLYPAGDNRVHTEGVWCECNPRVIKKDGVDWVIHWYYDHREIVLEAEIAMGFRCKDCLEYINEKGEHVAPPPLFYE